MTSGPPLYRLKCGHAVCLSSSRWERVISELLKLQIAKFTFTPSKEELQVWLWWMTCSGAFPHLSSEDPLLASGGPDFPPQMAVATEATAG